MNPKFCVPELMMQNTKNRVYGNPNCFQQPIDNVEGNKYHSIIVPHTYANVPVNKGCSNGTVDRYNNHPHYTNWKEKWDKNIIKNIIILLFISSIDVNEFLEGT